MSGALPKALPRRVLPTSEPLPGQVTSGSVRAGHALPLAIDRR